MAERRTNPWVAFTAGAVAMLALALAGYAWLGGGDAAEEAVRAAAGAADAVPSVPRPRLPDAPRIPDAPLPIPK